MTVECRIGHQMTMQLSSQRPEGEPKSVTFDSGLIRGATIYIGVITQDQYITASELMARGLVDDVYPAEPELGFVAVIEDPDVLTPKGRMVALRDIIKSIQASRDLHKGAEGGGMILMPWEKVIYGGEIEVHELLGPEIAGIVSEAVGQKVTPEALFVDSMIPDIMLRLGLVEDTEELAHKVPELAGNIR